MTDFSVVRPTASTLTFDRGARNFVAFANALYLSQQSWSQTATIGLNRVSPRSEHFLSAQTYPSFGKCTTLIKLSNALFLGTSHASSLYRLLQS